VSGERGPLPSRHGAEEACALEDWVADEKVDVLAQTRGPTLDQGRRLVGDLRGVRSIDECGLALFAGWAGEALVLRRPSAFIRQLLENGGIPSVNNTNATQ